VLTLHVSGQNRKRGRTEVAQEQALTGGGYSMKATRKQAGFSFLSKKHAASPIDQTTPPLCSSDF